SVTTVVVGTVDASLISPQDHASQAHHACRTDRANPPPKNAKVELAACHGRSTPSSPTPTTEASYAKPVPSTSSATPDSKTTSPQTAHPVPRDPMIRSGPFEDFGPPRPLPGTGAHSESSRGLARPSPPGTRRVPASVDSKYEGCTGTGHGRL